MAANSPTDKHKTTHHKKPRPPKEIKSSRFSKSQLIIFGLIFAAIGGFAIWRALAAPAPTVSISVSPADITQGQTTTIYWTPTTVESCTASTTSDNPAGNGIWSGSRDHSNGTHFEAHNNYPAGTYNLTITCSTGTFGEDVSDTAVLRVVTPPPPPRPTVNLTANPASIPYNGQSTLSWTSTNATSCTASGAWSGSKPVSGSQSTGHLISSKIYSLSCSGAGGQQSDGAAVNVGPRAHPTVTLIANPPSIAYNGYSYLQWNSTNADSCSASWTASHATSGSQRVGRLTHTTSYTITCSGNGSATDPATVTVGAPPINCPPHCPTPPPPAPPRSLPPPPAAATEEPAAPAPEPVIDEEPAATEQTCHKPSPWLRIILGGLTGELINLIKHTCK
jgi:hypothetical protein